MALALRDNAYHTYADYLAWPEDVRYELIDGMAQSHFTGQWQMTVYFVLCLVLRTRVLAWATALSTSVGVMPFPASVLRTRLAGLSVSAVTPLADHTTTLRPGT